MQTVALFAEPDRLSSVAEWMTFRDRFCSPFLNVKGLHTALELQCWSKSRFVGRIALPASSSLDFS